MTFARNGVGLYLLSLVRMRLFQAHPFRGSGFLTYSFLSLPVAAFSHAGYHKRSVLSSGNALIEERIVVYKQDSE